MDAGLTLHEQTVSVGREGGKLVTVGDRSRRVCPASAAWSGPRTTNGRCGAARVAGIRSFPGRWTNAQVERMKRRGPKLGHLESAVLSIVAAKSEPVTVAEVQAALPGDPAYTTVMSTLARLAEKGALRRTLEGRAYRYEAAAPAGLIDDALSARQMRHLLTHGGDRAGVLARFVAELDEEEEQMLAELLARSRRPKPKSTQ